MATVAPPDSEPRLLRLRAATGQWPQRQRDCGRELAMMAASRQSFVSATTINVVSSPCNSRGFAARAGQRLASERELVRAGRTPSFQIGRCRRRSFFFLPPCCILGIPARSFQNNCTNSAFADSSGSPLPPFLLRLLSLSLSLSLSLPRGGHCFVSSFRRYFHGD